MTNTLPNPGEAAGLRALLEGVRAALTLPFDAPDYDRRMLDRASLVRTTIDGALTEHPADIGWDVGYLARKVVQEEEQAAEREANRCRRCRKSFEDDGPFDGRARYRDTPWCRSCVDNCHDGGTEHVCMICEPSRYTSVPALRGDTERGEGR